MICLGIESTCDETAIAVVRDDFTILSNVIYSQVDLHSPFGGVFPELAAREHVAKIAACYEEALEIAGIQANEIEMIAVAYGPGLIGSIQIGLTFAKSLALALNVPLVAVNHVHAHLIAPLLEYTEAASLFPAIGLVISGGHTQINWMETPLDVATIGSTIDDAIGECFDKCAKLCKLPYPGGPHVERLAKLGDPSKVALKSCRVKDNPLAFSYSGLKTQVLYALKNPDLRIEDLLAAFQHTVFTDLVEKMKKAQQWNGKRNEKKARAIFVGGGVASSQTLREYFKAIDCPVFFPSKDLSLDNGAMIAALGILQFKKENTTSYDIEPQTRIPFAQFTCT